MVTLCTVLVVVDVVTLAWLLCLTYLLWEAFNECRELKAAIGREHCFTYEKFLENHKRILQYSRETFEHITAIQDYLNVTPLQPHIGVKLVKKPKETK